MRYWLLLLAVLSIPAYAERPDNEIPEYGGRHERTLPTDSIHSKEAADLGWDYLYKGNLDTAIKRFNQAWLLDDRNFQAYWGFGVVCGKRAVAGENPEPNIKDSVRYIEKALSMTKPDARLLTDLGVSHMTYGELLEAGGKKDDSKKELQRANETFAKAGLLDSKYPVLYENWSYTLFYLGDYPAAQKKMERAKTLGVKFPAGYANELLQKVK